MTCRTGPRSSWRNLRRLQQWSQDGPEEAGEPEAVLVEPGAEGVGDVAPERQPPGEPCGARLPVEMCPQGLVAPLAVPGHSGGPWGPGAWLAKEAKWRSSSRLCFMFRSMLCFVLFRHPAFSRSSRPAGQLLPQRSLRVSHALLGSCAHLALPLRLLWALRGTGPQKHPSERPACGPLGGEEALLGPRGAGALGCLRGPSCPGRAPASTLAA